MTRTSRSRLISLLIFILTFTMIVCSMSVAVFAHEEGDGHDHEGEGSTTTTEKTVWDKIGEWFDSTVGQIVGYCVAGVIFVACVIFIIWWIPKKNDGKEKKSAKK